MKNKVLNDLLIQMQQHQNTLAGVDTNDNVPELQATLKNRDDMLDSQQHDQIRISESTDILSAMLNQLDEAFNQEDVEIEFEGLEEFIQENTPVEDDINDDININAALAIGTIEFRPTNINSPMCESDVLTAMEELKNVAAQLGCEVNFNSLDLVALTREGMMTKSREL